MSGNSLNKMDRLGLMLSIFSVAVVAYRNDLSSTRHGCIWSTIGTSSNSSSSSGGSNINPLLLQALVPSSSSLSSGGSLNCNLRTLSMDFWNYTFNREQIEQTRLVRVKCSDKIFFESLLSPNQTFFQLRNLKEVQIESCKIRKLPKRVWASLTRLKTLVIRTENTEWSGSVGLEIEQGAFDGLGQLEVLDLSQNNIWTFPKTSLCPLRSLLKLNVSYNRLTDIEELSSHDEEDSSSIISSSSSSGSVSRDNYCALSVQNLDLSYNSLRTVGSDAFSRMRKLTELRLQENMIAELEDSAFGGLSQLKLLNLTSNRLVALPPSIFKSNSNLRELYLQNNSISALSSQVFSKMDHLLLLDLSRNSLTSQWIKEDMFHGLIRLVVLKLSWNQLSYIDSVIFRDLISLQALHLDNNRLETINPEAFQTLSNLHILDLSNNRLTYVDSKIFSNLFVLRQLYMDHNKLRKMDDDSLKNCTSLQDLGLADNAFTEVPVALQTTSLGLLKTMDIGENKIVHVSNESFLGMSQLYGLRMVDNRITELPNGFCEPLKKLRVLNLSQNRIQKISSSAFISCPELRVLRLDTNAMEELPNTLSPQLPSLLWLNVSENRLSWADYHLLPQTIEWLDLSYNSLESLSGPLTSGDKKDGNSNNKMPYHLRVLDLSHNKLKHLDSTAIPASLETLRVNHNELKTVAPDTFIRSSRIRRVELIGNQIENLPLSSLRLPAVPNGKPLPEFYLGANPFLCDCTMEWLTRMNQLTVLRSHPRIVDLDAIVCRTSFSRSTATNQTLVPLVETRPKDFLCPYKSHCFHLCQCCEFDACDCEMICPSNCTCYHDTAWSSNIVQCSNLNYEDVPSRIPMDATEIFLDGNRIFELGSHIFIGKKNLRTLYLNDSHVEFIRNKTFNGLRSLEILRLEENLLTELQGYEFSDLENLRELYLHNNLIRFIAPDTFANLKFLQVLRLDFNQIADFNVWELSGNGYLNSVMLSGNPWNCDCEFLIPFRNWVATKTAIVVDFTLAKCQMLSPSNSYSWSETSDNQDNDDDGHMNKQVQEQQQVQPTIPINSMCISASSPDITFNYDPSANNEIEINNHISPMGGAAEKVASANPPPSVNHANFDAYNNNTFWALILCLTAFLIVVSVIVWVFRQEIYYWSKNALFHGVCSYVFCCFCCPGKSGGRQSKISCPSEEDQLEKLFDAYFLYSKKDEDLLLQKIAPELELPGCPPGTPRHFRLCLHYRDLCLNPENPWNREMILSACDASKRVVIVLSREFLQSEWNSSSHFRQAIQSAISLHQKKLIFILLPTFAGQNLSTISTELKPSSNPVKNSSLEWTDKNFWAKFRNLLPNPSGISQYHHQGDSINTMSSNFANCEPHQLPYNLIMNPNLHHHQQHLNQTNTLQHYPHHYHQNIIPYQIPMMTRNNSLPPVPKHQIVLPAAPQLQNWQVQRDHHHLQGLQQNINGLLNPHGHPHQNLKNHEQQQHHNHNAIILPTGNHSLIHPIPAQLTPQQFGYSNEAFHLQQSNHHHNNHPGRNNNQPIHFSSSSHLQQNPHHHQQSISVIPPHSHSSSQVSNSNFSSVCCYPHHHPQQSNNNMEQNYSSSAVSSANEGEFDHVYSTLDSPLQSPNSEIIGNGQLDCGDNGGIKSINCSRVNQHQTQHSTSSGISSGSDMTSGDISGSSAVSPSSPIKNGIINKLNSHSNNNSSNNQNCNNSNGKMYFV